MAKTKIKNLTNQQILFTHYCKQSIGIDIEVEYKFHKSRKWRFDYAIPEYMLAIEVEGGVWTQGRHTRPVGFLKDMDKYNAAAVLGWRILRVIPDELLTVMTMEMIEEAIKYKNDERKNKTDK